MTILVKKIFSVEDGDFLYGYDLVNETYMGARYIVTMGLNLDALSQNEALQKLYAFRGHIFRFDNQKEFLRMFDPKRTGPLNY